MTVEELMVESCFADFEEGDRAGYLNLDPFEVILGTVIKVTENRAVFRLDSGEVVLATETGSPKHNVWSSAISQWKKIPDLSLINISSVLSRLEGIDDQKRSYLEVVSIQRHKRIVLKRQDGNLVVLAANEEIGASLESKLFDWTLEA